MIVIFLSLYFVLKGKVAELKHGAELSLGVKSSAAAKKGSLKHSFVAFIYKSGSGEEQDVHEAFQETGGPSSTYECSKALGSGAFAEVRLCFHRRTGTKYAAKIVDKNKFALNKELRKGSFRDEVEILKSINSPYIVRCEDIFETDNYLTIILQYVSGGDLFDKLVALKRYQG
jgi:serine/threonine protein kinase